MTEVVPIEGCSSCAPLIAALRAENAELRTRNAELERRDEERQAQIASLMERVAALEERLRQNSSNSHLPPSSNRPGTVPPKPVKEPSGRKRGGQPGHPGKARELLPVEEVDLLVECRPSHCKDCGGELQGYDGAPLRHQVTEIPPIRPHVTEYQLHTLCCERCFGLTRAPLPPGVPEGAFGPRLQAIVSVASGSYQLSKRKIELMLHDFFGAKASLGSIVRLQQSTSRALEAPVEEAKKYVQAQAQANMDETSWKEGPKTKAWVWVLVSGLVAVFSVQANRSTKAAQSLLGRFAGVLGTDRLKSYNFLALLRHQFCWAHLKRDFRKIADRGGSSKAIGEGLLLCHKDLFAQLGRLRRGEIRPSTFVSYATGLRVKLRKWLHIGAACDEPKTRGTCRELLASEPAMWTFVRVPGVQPTNNISEQALRQAVIWRKLSFGTASAEGSRFVERMLTAVHSLRLQKRNVLEFVTAACEAALHNRPPPSLLPADAHALKLTG
jgi:transposase